MCRSLLQKSATGDKWFFLLCLVLIAVTLISLLTIATQVTVRTDFIQYWVSRRLFVQGINAYDPQIMLEWQQKAGLPDAQPRMLWCPPWVLLFMYPVLVIPSLVTAQKVWLYASTGLFLGCLSLTFYALQKFSNTNFHRFLVLGYGIASPQLWDLFKLGQCTVLLLVFYLLGLMCVMRRKEFLGGVLLAGLTIKPHLFYLIWTFLLWHAVIQKNWKIIGGIVCGLLLLAGTTYIVFPHALVDWLQTFQFQEKDGLVVARGSWVCATIPSILRKFFDLDTPILSVLIPSLVMLSFCWLLIQRRIHLTPIQAMIVLLPLSLATGPYGWYYDQIVLLPIVMGIAALIPHIENNITRWVTASLFVASTAGAGIYHTLFAKWEHEFWWVSITIFAALLIAVNAKKSSPGSGVLNLEII